MDYSAFKFKAVVDWIEIEIHLRHASNGGSIRDWIGTFAEPQDEGDGGAATVFRLRLQDPRSWHHVEDWIERIEQAIQDHGHALAAPTTIPGIEVAFDARMRHDVLEQQGHLAAMAAHLYCSLGNTVSDNHRYPGNKGTRGMVREVTGREESIADELYRGREIAIGDRGGKESQRIYVKGCNQRGSARLPLPRRKHRARVEITLIDNPDSPATLDAWKAFDFATLAPKYFTFRQRKPRWTRYVEAEIAANALTQYGALPLGAREQRVKSRRYSHKPKRMFPLWTTPDGALNAIARRMLIRLTKCMAGDGRLYPKKYEKND